MQIDLIGYHGTKAQDAEEIIRNDFVSSKGSKEWLGDGVYFFTKGLSNTPESQAKEWAIAQAWDNINKENTYKRVSVLKADIEVEEDAFLDLTTSQGIEVIDYIIDQHQKKIEELNKKRLNYIDGLIINFARNEKILPIEVVKGDFYIKFSKERILRINRRVSNATIISVSLPNIKNKKLISTHEIG